MWAWLLQRERGLHRVPAGLHLCFTSRISVPASLLAVASCFAGPARHHAGLQPRPSPRPAAWSPGRSASASPPWSLRGLPSTHKEVRMPCNRQKLFATYAYFATILSKAKDVPKPLPVDYRQPRNHHHSGRSAANPEQSGISFRFREFACRVNMCGSCGMVINGREGWPVDQRHDLPADQDITLRRPVIRISWWTWAFFSKYERAALL